MSIQTLGDFLFNAIEGTAADEQNITGIDMNIVLIRMLAATLGRYIHHGTFKKFQKSLLNTLTADITGNGRIVALTGNLINLINKDNTTLRRIYIIIGHLQQTGKNTLHILTDISGFGKYRCIYNGKRHMQQFGNGSGQQGFSGTRASDHDDI